MTFKWRQAAEIAKELQVKYKIPIFAMTFKGSCSCCAEPSNLNDEAYLTPDIKKNPGKKLIHILSSVILITQAVKLI